jgi:hypothetical protein
MMIRESVLLPCAGPGCTHQVVQQPGRRQRTTCSAACRQRLCQQRKREQALAACRQLWQGWPDPVQQCLETVLGQYGPALAAELAHTLADVCGPRGGAAVDSGRVGIADASSSGTNRGRL